MAESNLESYLITVNTETYALTQPASPTYPLVTYAGISDEAKTNLDGSVYLTEAKFRVDAWGQTYSSAKAIANQVITDLNGHSGDFQGLDVNFIKAAGIEEIYDTDLNLFKVPVEVTIYY